MENQHPEMVAALRSEIVRAKAHLSTGGRLSEIAGLLHAQGLVRHAAFGGVQGGYRSFAWRPEVLRRWWEHHGVTDEAAFDAWGAEVLSRSPA